MRSNLQASAAPSARPSVKSLTAGGTTGNERLTATTGVVLIALLAVIGVTIISLRQLLWVHLFVGMLLIGPVALKLGSTGYRFARYYTGNLSYRRVGPPPALLRAIAPMVVPPPSSSSPAASRCCSLARSRATPGCRSTR